MIKKATWFAGNERITVCQLWISHLPQPDAVVCHVLTLEGVRHCRGSTADEAEANARKFVEETFGPIRRERPEYAGDVLRIARWQGVPALVGRNRAVGLSEAWVNAIAGLSHEREVHGFFARRVLAALPAGQQEILNEWLAAGQWSEVLLDAIFASLQPDVDYNPA